MTAADDRNSEKLDRIGQDVADVRVSVATLTADVRHMLQRLERHDADHLQDQVAAAATTVDVERRLRALERWRYTVPGLGAILGVAGFALAAWQAFTH